MKKPIKPASNGIIINKTGIIFSKSQNSKLKIKKQRLKTAHRALRGKPY
jgi:hypothetical protein